MWLFVLVKDGHACALIALIFLMIVLSSFGLVATVFGGGFAGFWAFHEPL